MYINNPVSPKSHSKMRRIYVDLTSEHNEFACLTFLIKAYQGEEKKKEIATCCTFYCDWANTYSELYIWGQMPSVWDIKGQSGWRALAVWQHCLTNKTSSTADQKQTETKESHCKIRTLFLHPFMAAFLMKCQMYIMMLSGVWALKGNVNVINANGFFKIIYYFCF